MPWEQRCTRVSAARLTALAAAFILGWPELPPMGSVMEPDWSTRNMKQAGLARLMAAV